MEQELTNALKLYLIGKKNIDTDNQNSLMYFKKSIENLRI